MLNQILLHSFFPPYFRANDGCLYVYDLEQNKRTLKVNSSINDFCYCCICVCTSGKNKYY